MTRFARLLIVASIAGLSTVLAFAGCLAPTINISVASGVPQSKVTVTGTAFVDGCHDVCVNGVCPPTYPAKGIKIFFIQGNRTQELARVDANERFGISASITIPADAKPGRAEIIAETLYENRLLRTRPVEFSVTEQPPYR